MRALWVAALLALGCQASSGKEPVGKEAGKVPPLPAEETDVTAEHYQAPALPLAQVLLKDAFGGTHRVEVEVAATPESRQRGLMWRRELPAGKGMLFIFPYESVQSFWMQNTLIPLDMLFINDAHEVVGIVERAEPLTRTSRTVGIPTRYVLEVPGGWTEQVGVRTGARVQLDGLSSIRVH